MHEYLIGMQKYFGGEFRFMVIAQDKEHALEEAKKTDFYRDDRYMKDTLRVVKKLKPSHYGSEPWKRMKEGYLNAQSN